MPLLGFDIETANILTLARGENLDDHGPLAYLSRMQHEGHSIVAWNGLSILPTNETFHFGAANCNTI